MCVTVLSDQPFSPQPVKKAIYTLWDPHVHYRLHNSSTTCPTAKPYQSNPRNPCLSLRSILILYPTPVTPRCSGLFFAVPVSSLCSCHVTRRSHPVDCPKSNNTARLCQPPARLPVSSHQFAHRLPFYCNCRCAQFHRRPAVRLHLPARAHFSGHDSKIHWLTLVQSQAGQFLWDLWWTKWH
jgi:hypothetical protein